MASPFRVGFGTDSHQFLPGQRHGLVSRLGGVPLGFSVQANSDGDVICHALCDALTGAIGERDLSSYADQLCAQGRTDSQEYVRHAYGLVKAAGYQVANVSIVFEGKKPFLTRVRDQIRQNLAALLEVSPEAVGLSAKTGEGLDDIGRGYGFKASTTVLLVHASS